MDVWYGSPQDFPCSHRDAWSPLWLCVQVVPLGVSKTQWMLMVYYLWIRGKRTIQVLLPGIQHLLIQTVKRNLTQKTKATGEDTDLVNILFEEERSQQRGPWDPQSKKLLLRPGSSSTWLFSVRRARSSQRFKAALLLKFECVHKLFEDLVKVDILILQAGQQETERLQGQHTLPRQLVLGPHFEEHRLKVLKMSLK